uniref:Uncharacterized protein n=1 Tax=Triticum urartu TaxID=4572 RepID=A0A8R7QJX3_TRIUA
SAPSLGKSTTFAELSQWKFAECRERTATHMMGCARSVDDRLRQPSISWVHVGRSHRSPGRLRIVQHIVVCIVISM